MWVKNCSLNWVQLRNILKKFKEICYYSIQVKICKKYFILQQYSVVTNEVLHFTMVFKIWKTIHISWFFSHSFTTDRCGKHRIYYYSIIAYTSVGWLNLMISPIWWSVVCPVVFIALLWNEDKINASVCATSLFTWNTWKIIANKNFFKKK